MKSDNSFLLHYDEEPTNTWLCKYHLIYRYGYLNDKDNQSSLEQAELKILHDGTEHEYMDFLRKNKRQLPECNFVLNFSKMIISSEEKECLETLGIFIDFTRNYTDSEITAIDIKLTKQMIKNVSGNNVLYNLVSRIHDYIIFNADDYYTSIFTKQA